MDDNLIRAYAAERRAYRMRPAVAALADARVDVAKGKPQYGSAEFYPPFYGLCFGAWAAKYPGMRWVEKASQGLRFVGTAHDITRENGYYRDAAPEGWYVDDFHDEIAAGGVWLLPHGRYLGGMIDPNNDDDAWIDFGTIFDDKMRAARHGDHIAEGYAEREREYNEAWQAARRYEDLRAQIASDRAVLRALLRELKDYKRRGVSLGDTVCMFVRKRVEDLRAGMHHAYSEAQELHNTYSRAAGWEG